MSEKKEKSKRGLASASPETRKRVSTLGGKASRGGGRRPKQERTEDASE